MNDSQVINFYRVRDKYGCFSNFSNHSVVVDEVVWPTSEHYFQAQKFAGTSRETKIRKAKSPKEAADLGRDKNYKIRSDWEQVKDDIMRKVVLAKFLQNADAQAVLLETGDSLLVEHTANDKYWGDGGNGMGRNMLGKILMETRDKIRELNKCQQQ